MFVGKIGGSGVIFFTSNVRTEDDGWIIAGIYRVFLSPQGTVHADTYPHGVRWSSRCPRSDGLHLTKVHEGG